MTLPFAKFAWEVLVPVKNGRMFTLPRFVDCEFSCGHDAMHRWTQFLFRVLKIEVKHHITPSKIRQSSILYAGLMEQLSQGTRV